MQENKLPLSQALPKRPSEDDRRVFISIRKPGYVYFKAVRECDAKFVSVGPLRGPADFERKAWRLRAMVLSTAVCNTIFVK